MRHSESAVARAATIAGAVLLATTMFQSAVGAAAPPAATTSALGDVYVQGITVSPAYLRTGTVAVDATRIHCSKDCFGLWITHDGGATWHRSAIRAYQPQHVAIGIDAHGREVFIAHSPKFLVESDDGGETWKELGTAGVPTVLPTFATEGAVAVAENNGPADYALADGTSHDVTGSDGYLQDLQFAVAPTFPHAGAYSPALLMAMKAGSRAPFLLRCTASLDCPQRTQLPVPSAVGQGGSVIHIADDYATSGTVFVSTPTGIVKSLDGGASFRKLDPIPPLDGALIGTPALALAPGYREHGPIRTVYAAVYEVRDQGTLNARQVGGIYKSTDGGATWSPVTTSGPFAGGAGVLAIAPDGRLFAQFTDGLGTAGLLCSADDGASWHASCPRVGEGTPATSDTAAVVQDGGTHWWLYALAAGGLAVLLTGAALLRRRVRTERA